VHVTDQDAFSAYQHWVKDVRDQETVDVRILALRVPGGTQQQLDARMALARELTRRARGGEDFCKLVQQYSDDLSTRAACGSRGPQAFGTMMPSIQEAVRATKPGTVSDPIPVNVGQDEAIVILMPMGSGRVPGFAEVKDEMMQKALLDGLERARKQWLADLRRNVYIDVRL
jgi:parvulin-like peptidyl-prolyl isomerase